MEIPAPMKVLYGSFPMDFQSSLVVWSSVMAVCGALCVTMAGTTLMQPWSASNCKWDT